MSRSTTVIKKVKYRFWIRVDTAASGGFPKDLLEAVANLTKNPKTRKHVRACTKNKLIVDVPIFDILQADLDIVPKCEISLFAENMKTKQMKALRTSAKMYGKTKDEYDEILRLIRY